MRRLGQYEVFDPGMWEGYDFSWDYDLPSYEIPYYEAPVGEDWPSETRYVEPYQVQQEAIQAPVEDWPSESRYVETYQAQQEAIQAKVEGGSGFFDILKSIIGLTTPVATSILRAEKKQPTVTQRPTTTTAIGVPVKTAGIGASIQGIVGTITSNPLLLAGLGIGGFLLLRGRGDRQIKARRKYGKAKAALRRARRGK